MESDTKSDGVRYEVRWSPIRSPIESDTSPIENPIESPINSDRVRWESPITQSDNESGPLCLWSAAALCGAARPSRACCIEPPSFWGRSAWLCSTSCAPSNDWDINFHGGIAFFRLSMVRQSRAVCFLFTLYPYVQPLPLSLLYLSSSTRGRAGADKARGPDPIFPRRLGVGRLCMRAHVPLTPRRLIRCAGRWRWRMRPPAINPTHVLRRAGA